jgi:hypothetical protein
MSRYLLDTDWIVDVLNGQARAIQTVLELVPSGLAVSIITYGNCMKVLTTPGILRLPWLAYMPS